MDDVTKCINDDCSKKLSCYRFLTPGSLLQAYSLFEVDGNDNCDYYIPTLEYCIPPVRGA